MKECTWKEDEDGVWFTACDEAWVFTEGYPWDNKARFCFACGRPIAAVRYIEPSTEDDDPAPSVAASQESK